MRCFHKSAVVYTQNMEASFVYNKKFRIIVYLKDQEPL